SRPPTRPRWPPPSTRPWTTRTGRRWAYAAGSASATSSPSRPRRRATGSCSPGSFQGGVMSAAEVIFWVAAGFVLYPYVVYPLSLAAVGRLFARPVRRRKGFRPSVSFVLCVHNEAARIETRLLELVAVLEATGIPGEI